MISYKPLVQTLTKHQKSIYDLQDYLHNPRLRQTLNSNRYITMQTLDEICKYLHCKVTDVIVYEEGKQDRKEIKDKEYVSVNWTKLKLKCEGLRTSFCKMSKRMDKSPSYLSSMSVKRHIGKDKAIEIARHFNCQLEEIIYTD